MDHEGVFRWEVDNVSELSVDGWDSPEYTVAGLTWWVNVYSELSDDMTHLGANVYCRHESGELWKCEHATVVRLINLRDEENGSISVEFTDELSIYKDGCREYELASMETVLDEANGFIENDKIALEATINVKKTVGVRNENRDFGTKDALSDVALIVEGKKVYVSKSVLAFQSPVFHAMFYGEFKERNQAEVEIGDVNYDEFVEFMKHVYLVNREWNDEKIDYILRLCDRFQMKEVRENAEIFVIYNSEKDTVEKLMISDQYKLELLQMYCMNKIDSLATIKSFEEHDAYWEFSDTLKARIHERTMELLDQPVPMEQ